MLGMPPSEGVLLSPLQSIPLTPAPLRNSQAPRARMKGRRRTKSRQAAGWLQLLAGALPHAVLQLVLAGPAPALRSAAHPSSCPRRCLPGYSIWTLPPRPCIWEAGKVAESGEATMGLGRESKKLLILQWGVLA